MNLSKLKDTEVLSQIKTLVSKERYLLTEVLHHLREVDYRKLFSDLGYQSLFQYAVKELKYSEGQAGRRLQAMRLLKELPEVESKIQSGALSLVHLAQTQSYFNDKLKNQQTSDENLTLDELPLAQTSPTGSESKINILSEKLALLEKLENTSTRESEKIILSLNPNKPLPSETHRAITPQHTEVKFVMDESLKNSLDEVRALLGTKAINMTLAELISEMSQLSVTALKTKKFGKKRTLESQTAGKELASLAHQTHQVSKPNSSRDATPALELAEIKNESLDKLPIKNHRPTKNISQATQYQVWKRDGGRCRACSSKLNLNIDHIHPKRLGGDNSLENLRLLCFHCNQRRAIKTYGIQTVKAAAYTL